VISGKREAGRGKWGRLRPPASGCRLLVALVLACSSLFPLPSSLLFGQLPARLADREFWQLIGDLSEPPGYFDSDNLLSNEGTYQYVLAPLGRAARTGSVYVGVGPEQNFTYMVALQPKMAFIIDVRRGNLLEHLVYKALFELSADRADFVSRLFSRARPPGLDTTAAVGALFRAYAAVVPDEALYRRNLAAVTNRLVTVHGFALSPDDLKGIEYIYGAFFSAGPELDYNYPNPSRGGFARGGSRPSYADLMTANDGHGVPRGYLASETSYRSVKALEEKNLVVPVVGDFGGPQAVRAVGAYVRDHNATVGAFYTSNVEQYLFRQGDAWSRFYSSIATLPLDSSSTFIRAVFNSGGVRVPGIIGSGSVTLICPMTELVAAWRDGRVRSYYDVVQMSR
jgi:hypothetical protein